MGGEEATRRPGKSRRRRIRAVVLLLLAGGLLAAFLGRDLLLLHLARWTLARTFDGQVSIRSAHIDSLGSFTLTDLSIRTEGAVTLRASLPEVRGLVASPAHWLRGRLKSVRSEGADVTIDLRQLGTQPLPHWLTESEGRVGLLALNRCVARVISRAGSVELDLDVRLLRGARFDAALRTAKVQPAGRRGTWWSADLPVKVEGSFDAPQSTVRLTVTDISLEALTPALQSALGVEVALAGTATLEVVGRSGGRGFQLKSTAVVDQVSGSWAAAGAEWEGVSGSLNLDWQRVPGSDVIRVSLHTGSGGVLLGDAYVDFGEFAFDSALSCRWESKAARLELNDFSAGLAGLVDVELTGEVARGEHPRSHLQGELYVPAVERASALARSAFEGRSTLLSALRLGGWVEASFQLDLTPERTDLEGRLAWHSGSLEVGALQLWGVSLILPVQVARGQGRFLPLPEERAPAYGLFLAERVRLGPAGISLAPVSLRVAGDELQFAGDEQTLKLLGGEVVLRDLRCRRLASGSPQITCAVEVTGLSLAQLTESAPVPLAGTVSAHFPGLVAIGDAFHTEGTAILGVFGGTVTITELTGADLAQPWWRLAFSAELAALDLEQLTATFGWGRASGLLSGSVQGMVISAGEPERFEIELRNERAPGVAQTLTVEVLDRIPVISAVAPLLRAVGVETLQYDALGLWCRLENDRLWVRGTAGEQLPQETPLPIPILGPLLGAVGEMLRGPQPEGEFLIVGRSGLRSLNVVLEPVPEEGLSWPVIWQGLRAAVGRTPTIELESSTGGD